MFTKTEKPKTEKPKTETKQAELDAKADIATDDVPILNIVSSKKFGVQPSIDSKHNGVFRRNLHSIIETELRPAYDCSVSTANAFCIVLSERDANVKIRQNDATGRSKVMYDVASVLASTDTKSKRDELLKAHKAIVAAKRIKAAM